MFWEQLSLSEQGRYWYIFQRLKKYVAAGLQLPKAEEEYEKFMKGSLEERAKLIAAEERRINHFRKPDKHIKIDIEAHINDLKDTLYRLWVDRRDNFCTDEELIEADRLSQKGWG